jgi:hypothetical protein
MEALLQPCRELFLHVPLPLLLFNWLQLSTFWFVVFWLIGKGIKRLHLQLVLYTAREVESSAGKLLGRVEGQIDEPDDQAKYGNEGHVGTDGSTKRRAAPKYAPSHKDGDD